MCSQSASAVQCSGSGARIELQQQARSETARRPAWRPRCSRESGKAQGFAGWCLWVPLCAPDKPASPLTRRAKSSPSTASTPPLSCKPTLRRRTPLRLAAAGGAALPAKRLGSLARPAQCAPGPGSAQLRSGSPSAPQINAPPGSRDRCEPRARGGASAAIRLASLARARARQKDARASRFARGAGRGARGTPIGPDSPRLPRALSIAAASGAAAAASLPWPFFRANANERRAWGRRPGGRADVRRRGGRRHAALGAFVGGGERRRRGGARALGAGAGQAGSAAPDARGGTWPLVRCGAAGGTRGVGRGRGVAMREVIGSQSRDCPTRGAVRTSADRSWAHLSRAQRVGEHA